MKEIPLSNCEKAFVLNAIAQNQRLDGRRIEEYRPLEIFYGTDWGCCQVSLGETKVLAQVSCEIEQPRSTRPNEGLLYINIEMSPMGAPHFEVGRMSELGVQLNRLLEKCIKDSRCVDLESLCIMAEEKVWALRVDVHVLNHEGNLLDCASVAALAAIAHFRRPDVTLLGQEIKVHDPSERDPIPISLHHHPVCISYALFNKGNKVVADPTSIEERALEAQIVFAVNAYRELCSIHLGGNTLASPDLICKYADKAAVRAAAVVLQIKDSLAKDSSARSSGESVGFVECVRKGKITSLSKDKVTMQLARVQETADEIVRNGSVASMDEDDKDREEVLALSPGSAELVSPRQRMSSEEPVSPRQGMNLPELDNPWQQMSSVGLACSKKLKKLQKKSEIGVGGPSTWEAGDGDNGNSESEAEDSEEGAGSRSSSPDVQLVKELTYEEKMKLIENIELSGDSEEEETVTLKAEELNLTQKGRSASKAPVKKTPTKKETKHERNIPRDINMRDAIDQGLRKQRMKFGMKEPKEEKEDGDDDDDMEEDEKGRTWYPKSVW